MRVLVLNAGSISLKSCLYDLAEALRQTPPVRLWGGFSNPNPRWPFLTRPFIRLCRSTRPSIPGPTPGLSAGSAAMVSTASAINIVRRARPTSLGRTLGLFAWLRAIWVMDVHWLRCETDAAWIPRWVHAARRVDDGESLRYNRPRNSHSSTARRRVFCRPAGENPEP